MRKMIVLLAALLLTMGMAQDYVFGIVYDAGGKFDRSFNEGTWRGVERAQKELEAAGNEVEVIEFEGTPATAGEGQRRIALQGAELIVAPGFSQADAITAAAKEFPRTSFEIIDAVAEGDNVRSVLFKEQEGSFLVGYIAGTLTRTGIVGFVGGMDVPLIRAFDLGYQEGVKAACADCTIISNYVGVTPDAWNDPARAKELASTQNAQGADIIYAAAGASGNGVIDFVNEKQCFVPSGATRPTPIDAQLENIAKPAGYDAKCGGDAKPIFFIGVDSNQNPLGDTDSDPTTLNFGLTSMLKRVDVASYEAVMDVVNGTFTGGVVNLGLAEDGVDYAVDEYNSALLPTDLVEAVNDVKQKIIDGDIVVTDYRQQ
ncbi:MAG: BMP family ABC transporter substrate-binding protein [Trueperaceae bacterium]|jgi:basic membrane protein A|nr:BMP family ABC transporter substrate-binding protein [Truepera sp.]